MARSKKGEPRHGVGQADARAARRMVRVLAGDLLPPQDVDDIAQEVLCALAFHAGPLPAGRTAAEARAAFLRREASRQIAEHGRLQAMTAIGDRLAIDVLPPPITPSAEDLSLASYGPLHRAPATLQHAEPTLVAVLDLALDGAPMAMAAGALGIPEGTAHSRFRRARKRIGALLGKHAGAGGCP